MSHVSGATCFLVFTSLRLLGCKSELCKDVLASFRWLLNLIMNTAGTFTIISRIFCPGAGLRTMQLKGMHLQFG